MADAPKQHEYHYEWVKRGWAEDLVQHSTKLGWGTIETVIDALEDLRKDYCN